MLIASFLVVIFLFLNRWENLKNTQQSVGVVLGFTLPHAENNMGYAALIAFHDEQNIIHQLIGPEDLLLKKGEMIKVLYEKRKPEQAYIYSFQEFWLSAICVSLGALLFLCAAIYSFIEAKDLLCFNLSRIFKY